jgi:hypothetical protein
MKTTLIMIAFLSSSGRRNMVQSQGRFQWYIVRTFERFMALSQGRDSWGYSKLGTWHLVCHYPFFELLDFRFKCSNAYFESTYEKKALEGATTTT